MDDEESVVALHQSQTTQHRIEEYQPQTQPRARDPHILKIKGERSKARKSAV